MRYEDDIKEAMATLKRGGLILYPTDTVWGIGCDATNSAAVKRVYDLKKRSDSKALIVLVDSLSSLDRVVAEVPEVAEQLIEAAVRPTTIIYDKGVGIAPEALAPDGSIGVRLTRERFSADLCRMLRKPLISTSANISGVPTPTFFSQISKEIIDGVDYVCSYRRTDHTPVSPSMVIKIRSNGEFKILRS